MSDNCTKESGTCLKCQGACERKPGWFTFGEAEKVAEYLGVTLKELFDTKLGVDWWEGGHNGNIFLLSPALVDEEPGVEFPGDPTGRCVFYQDGQCEIHVVKPFECRESVPCSAKNTDSNLHKAAADSWDNEIAQKQIVELLGREPESAEFTGGGLFGLFSMFR